MSNDVEANMHPDASPGEKSKSGVRKVNNMPLYILAFVVGIFLLIMMLVASDRAADQTTPAEEKALETRSSATNFANEITGQHESGFIQADDTQADIPRNTVLESVSPPTERDADYTTQPPGELTPTDRSSNTTGKTNVAGIKEEDLIRFQMMRLQLLEEAVRSKTSVNGFRTEGVNGGGGIGFSNSTQGQLSAVRSQIESIGARRNPNDVYKAKIDELKSMMSGLGGGSIGNVSGAGGLGSSANSTSGTPALLGSESWKLNTQMEAPETPYVLRGGYVIPGILISGINSDLPGQIMAQVSQDVYDTATGRHLLIPQGSRLVGSYSSQVAYGQSRVLTAWDRIIFPDGKALDIRGMQGADSAGYSGYKDKVNTHFWKVFSSAFLMSGIVAGVNLSQDSGGDGASDRQRASDAMSEALGQQLGQAMTQMIMKNLNIAPTIEVRPGYRFNVMVSKDMVFSKPYQSFDY